MVFTTSLLGAQHKRNSVKNKPAKSLVVSLGKELNGYLYVTKRPSFLCHRQVAGPSSLSVLVALSS